LDEFFPAYRKAFLAFFLAALLGSLGVVLVLLPLIVPFDVLWFALTLPYFFLGFFIVFGSLLIGLHSLSSIRGRVQVHSNGLLVKRLWSLRNYPWDQIVSVQYNGRNGSQDLPTTACYLRLQSGKRTCLPHVRDLDRLVRAIEEETATRLLPSLLQRFFAGEVIDFGRIQLSTQGVTKGPIVTPWQEIEHIIFDNDGWLTFARQGKEWRQWIVVSPNKVYNHMLLARLLDAIGSPISSAPGFSTDATTS
jgi:hypothetical protein